MSNTNISMFEAATRKKLRFPSARGDITVEQLWDAPLSSGDEFNLDAIAKAVNRTLRILTEESFVATARRPEQTLLELALSIIKHVIATKLDDEAKAKRRAGQSQEKAKLLEALAAKEDGELGELSREELEARIRALGD